MSSIIDTPVLIIGGGGCGLSSSIFLSNHGVEHLLVERHPGTAILPKAHYLNQRTMEVYRQHGIADAIYEVGCPIEKFGQIRWMTSLGGDGPLDRREIHAWTPSAATAFVTGTRRTARCWRPTTRNCASNRCCASRQKSAHRVRSATTTRSSTGSRATRCGCQRARSRHRRGVTPCVPATSSPRTAARPSARARACRWNGPTNMVDMVSTHFTADLSQYWDDETLITWFLNPEGAELLGCWRNGPDGPDLGPALRGVGGPLRVPPR